jgi:hypothetical protein
MYFIILFVIVLILVISALIVSTKSTFKTTLITPMDQIDQTPPKEFPSLSETETGGIQLEPPTVPEEIGFAMVYPQGVGVGMSKNDSDSFQPSNPSALLTDYTLPQSYGESNMSDSNGNKGAGEGARVLRINSTGNQLNYKPVDESLDIVYSPAYTSGEVQTGNVKLINNAKAVDYSDTFNPENNLGIRASTGQQSKLPICESWYPKTVKYDNLCITEGDIPYGQIVDNKVNPRLVSRWESYTGDYVRSEALKPIDGLLYPNLDVLVKN